MYIKTIKLIGFQPLRVNCCEINQVIPKCQVVFWTKLAKKDPNQKKDHNHQILHVRNSLGIEFQRKLKILNF